MDVVVVVDMQEALKACQLVNAPLLYRATKNIPYSVLKYAMTLDGTKPPSPNDDGFKECLWLHCVVKEKC